jgi:hypothetical protein
MTFLTAHAYFAHLPHWVRNVLTTSHCATLHLRLWQWSACCSSLSVPTWNIFARFLHPAPGLVRFLKKRFGKGSFLEAYDMQAPARAQTLRVIASSYLSDPFRGSPALELPIQSRHPCPMSAPSRASDIIARMAPSGPRRQPPKSHTARRFGFGAAANSRAISRLGARRAGISSNVDRVRRP